MKVSIKTVDGNQVTLNVQSSFKILVDNEILLEHDGPNTSDLIKRNSSDLIRKAIQEVSELFDQTPTGKRIQVDVNEDHDVEHIHFDVPNSSFIESIRWWSVEESIGSDALEINFKDGNYIVYQHVPKSVIVNWIDFIKSGGSAGRFYNQNIKRSYEVYTEGAN